MIRKLAGIYGVTFALVFVWKVALLIFTAQPVPANDSFFYDGAVVNHLLHGRYVNPSLAQVLPISANEIYSAYPPLYHLTLFGWMKLCGTSAMSQMWFHVLLFGAFELALLGVFRRLKTPAPCVNLAGLFLFSITFQDRPDSLAHWLGMLAVYAAVRSRGTLDVAGGGKSSPGWSWIATALVVLTACTSLQIGGFYFVLVWLLRRVCKIFNGEPLPVGAMMAAWLVPVGLVCLVKFGFPHLWAGFKEHAELTPTFTGFRLPAASDLLKIFRTVPGLFMATVMMRWALRRGDVHMPNRFLLTAVSAVIVSLADVGGALFVLTPNLVAIANYAQPLVMGCFLALLAGARLEKALPRIAVVATLVIVMLVSVRAIGMTTWGVLCSRDVSHASALQIINRELDATPPQSTVVVSSAYLYDVARRDHVQWIHSDWPGKPDSELPNWEMDALVALQPARLILTQFDYHRRYESVLAGLSGQKNLVTFEVKHFTHTRTPDSIRSMQKVVQHVSWSPVIVEFSWKPRLE